MDYFSRNLPTLSCVFFKVNKVDFSHFTREEAANFLLNIKPGELVEICTQNKMDSKCSPKLLVLYLQSNNEAVSHHYFLILM